MSRVASLEVRIAANISDFRQKMERALKVTRRFVDIMEQVDRSARGLGGGLDQAEAAQRKFASSLFGTNRRIDQLGETTLRAERQLTDVNATLGRLAGTAERVENALQPLPAYLARYNAELSDTRQASVRAAQSMDLVTKQLADIKASLNTSPAAYQRAERGIRSLQRTSQGARSQIRGVGDASKRSQNFLFSFGAAAEDSAFGFRGLANNIPLVIRDFSFLRQSAGGARGALSAIASGLVSPGGLIALLGIASSVAITFGDDIVAAFDSGAKELKKLRTQFQEAIEEVASFESTVVGVKVTPENIDALIRQTSAALEEGIRQGFGTRGDIAIDDGVIRDIVSGGENAVENLTDRLLGATLFLNEQTKETRRLAAERVQFEAQTLQTLIDQKAQFQLLKRAQEVLAQRGAFIDSDPEVARLREDIEALNDSAAELFRDLDLGGNLGTIERQAAALSEAFNLSGDLGTEGILKQQERINRAVEAQTDRRLDRKQQREEAVARASLAAQEAAIQRVERGYQRIYGVIQSQFAGLLNSTINTDSLLAIFGAGADNANSLRLQRFRLKEEEAQLRESLANRAISYEEYQLRVAELNERISSVQQRYARATEATFQRVFRSISQFVKGVVDGIIREINRAIARVIALRVIRSVGSPFASFLGGGGGAGQIISNPGFSTAAAPTQIVGVVEGDQLRLVAGRSEQNAASSGQLSL